MTPDLFLHIGVRPALALLPPQMSGPDAERMILAICWQESDGFKARRQYGGGPARGYPQFELGSATAGGGLHGVFRHRASAPLAREVCRVLGVAPTPEAAYVAIEYHDVLAAALARLLLWTLPGRLPREHERELAWHQYAVDAWRPGKPHPDRWPASWAVAVSTVLGAS